MNGEEFENRKRNSLKAAMTLYGERSVEGNSPSMDSQEASPQKEELHQARRDIGQFRESTRVAESIKARAEIELSGAKKTVRDLALKIEESNSRAKGLQKPRKPKWRQDESDSTLKNKEDYQYAEVMKELEHIKQDLSKLKLDMAFVLEEKRQAEKETEASSSKMWSYASSMEAIKREIQELNEEQVLVELARIEAVKEFEAIEGERKEDANNYTTKLEETRKKVNGVAQENEQAKELERKLAVTISDVNMLESELTLLKEMDRRVEKSESLKRVDEYSPLLKSVREELEAAKTELATIKDEGFNFMASMDVIRDELRHVREETAKLEKTEDKRDLIVQNLNAKILRATSKLLALSRAGEKAETIASNMSLSLEQLRTEAEAAKKERELISEETANIKAEIPKIESEVELAEEKLQAAMEELEVVKSSEGKALENLKNLIENTMRARASALQHSSTITISAFEYEYLTGRARGAEEIADKKVAAAQAWVEALKANEKEILMKADMAQREIKEPRVEEEVGEEVYESELPIFSKREVEGEFCRWGQNGEQNLKTGYRNGNMTPGKRARSRKFGSPGVRHASRSGSFAVRKRGNIAKFFGNKDVKTES